ncbi:MAG TPA: sigma-70 family RNA polymerase sigma factor [Planctomycetota bacterium]
MSDTRLDLPLHELLHQREWLKGLAQALVRDPHGAADAAQQTWLHALLAKSPLRDGRAWLSSVLANVVRAHHRTEARRVRREAAVAAQRDTAADAAAETNERFETQRTVAAAVQALAEPFRSTVLLHHFEGMSLAAIGKSQSVPAGTVRWRLFRAHELLREALASRCGGDWRRGLLLLCAPVRRSVLLAPAFVPLLLAAGLLATAVLWATGTFASDPPAQRAEVAAAARDEQHDAPADPRPARGAVEQVATAAAPANEPTPVGDQRAMVRARIVGSDGVPLGHATLRLVEAAFGDEKAPAELLDRLAPAAPTDPDGRVTLALRAPGELLALIGELPSGQLVARATFAASASGHAEQKVELHLANGDDRDLGTIELQATTAISGRVLDAEGRPLAGARVCALHAPFPQFCDHLAATSHVPYATSTATTDAGTGAFTLADVVADRVIVWASKAGYTSGWQLLDATAPFARCDDLVLRVAPVTKLEIKPRPQRVRVVDEAGAGIAEARVFHRASTALGSRQSGSQMTDRNGRTTLHFGNNEAAVELVLGATSDRPELGHAFVPQPPLDEDEIRLVLKAGTPFAVHARAADGAPIAAFTVRWEAVAPAVGEATATGDNGVAALSEPCTEATFVVEAPGCAEMRVPFVPGQTHSPLEVTLGVQRGITGIVTCEGKPVAGAWVSLLHCQHVVLLDGYRSVGARNGRWNAKSGPDGRFRIDQRDADVLRLQVRSDRHAPAITDRHDFDPVRGWNDVAIELVAGGAIEGVVRDREGRAVPRALIAIHDFHGDARTVFADGAGRFRCDRLRAGAHEVRHADRVLDGNWSSTLGLAGIEDEAPHPDCEVVDGKTTRFDVVADRCRVTATLAATGFDTRGWSVGLLRAHDGMPACKDAARTRDGSFVLTSSSTGPHDLRFTAPGGPLGNVSVIVRIQLVAGDNAVNVPLALAPFRGRAAGASGSRDSWAMLQQETPQQRITASVLVDPSTLEFHTPLAPVGENVLIESALGGGTREVGRFVVPAR